MKQEQEQDQQQEADIFDSAPFRDEYTPGTALPISTIMNDGNETVAALSDTNAAAAAAPATTTSASKNRDLWNFQQRGKGQPNNIMQSLTSQWQNSKSSREQILKSTQQHREQMKQGVQTLGTKLQQGSQDLSNTEQAQRLKQQFHSVIGNNLNLSKFKEATSTQRGGGGGLTNQLEMFNERMKEEALRRDVRREAEEACLKTMRDHLSEFLETQTSGTYEEWIFALHPENTQDASLLQDMEYKEVDLRFYVEESDHRRLWNEKVNDPHREIAARTRMWSSGTNSNPQHKVHPIVDLLGSETIQNDPSQPQPCFTPGIIDLFDQGASTTKGLPTMDPVPSTTSQEVGDLISF